MSSQRPAHWSRSDGRAGRCNPHKDIGLNMPGSAPDSSKGAPTDPDAPDSGIRFLGLTVLLPVTIRHCRVNTFVNDSEFIPCFPVAVP